MINFNMSQDKSNQDKPTQTKCNARFTQGKHNFSYSSKMNQFQMPKQEKTLANDKN